MTSVWILSVLLAAQALPKANAIASDAAVLQKVICQNGLTAIRTLQSLRFCGCFNGCAAAPAKAVDHIPDIAGCRAFLAIGCAYLDHTALAEAEICVKLPGSEHFLAFKAGYAKFRRFCSLRLRAATSKQQQCDQNNCPNAILFHLLPSHFFPSLGIFYRSKVAKSIKGIADS
jgi:hypothetical protein